MVAINYDSNSSEKYLNNPEFPQKFEQFGCYCNEYYRAKERFYSSALPGLATMNKKEEYLDNLITSICDDQDDLVQFESSLFFNVLFRADFIQISNDVKRTFYGKLCKTFILNDKIHEILGNIDVLDSIPHVKSDIFITLLQILDVQAVTTKTSLTLKCISRSQCKYTNNALYKNIDHIVITPSAYKRIFDNDDVKFVQLNFIFKLLKTEKLTLDGCNLNWKPEGNLLDGLNLNYLSMVNCGTNVNNLIRENYETFKDHLIELDVSECPIFNKTLMVISCLPLKKLVLMNCIKTRGFFIGNLWSEVIKFGNSVDAKVNIDLLWQQDTLKNSLKSLDLSFNNVSYDKLQKISELKVESLNITRTMKKLNIEMSLFENSFTNTLKTVKIKDIEIDFAVLELLSNIRLNQLEFTYDAVKSFGDFSQLIDKPLTNSLKELSLDLLNHCQLFISFISNINLQYFECLLGTWYYYNFDIFWNDSKRNSLEILRLTDGKISENDAKGISQLNLKSLSLHPFLFDAKEPILEILSSKNLQNTVIDLKIGGAYEVDDHHLNLISKFKKLEFVSMKILGIHLNRTFHEILSNLKKLKRVVLKIFIGLSINEEAAHALCRLSTTAELSITLIGLGKNWPLTLTRKAYHIFTMNSLIQTYEIPIRLEFSDCVLDQRCAEVFRSFNVESLNFSSCVFNNQFFETMLSGKLRYTLQDMCLKRVDLDHKQLRALGGIYLTRLSVMTSADDFSCNKLPLIVSSDRVSKSLCILRLAPYHCVPYIQNILKSKLSVYEYFSSDARSMNDKSK